MELDISKIIKLEGLVEKPIHEHYATTLRNDGIDTIENIEAIRIITDLTDDNVDIILIESEEDLKKYLSDVIIRFDTNPKNYLKEDYASLLRVIYKSLIYIYEKVAINLAPSAYSGDINDMTQSNYFILDCGTSNINV